MVKDWGNRLICRIDVTGVLSIQVVLLALYFWPYMYYVDFSIAAQLPKAHHSVNMGRADREDALIVSVLRDGKIYLDSGLLRSADRLRTELRDRVRSGSEKRVYIKADARAKYSAVNWVLDQVQRAGIEKVSFLTETPR